jgi:hypothetical protein
MVAALVREVALYVPPTVARIAVFEPRNHQAPRCRRNFKARRPPTTD